ncbi:GNAT family N-acetyltransferase [Oceanirhabdus sp. W0125-5]|uniref:GNAT family N-acetyltransferase n=1 Tax=Oceanirhabdus sp. W0125-5 TaxID=2999116 RepID=UPI0022F31410|nr:GNAT family N-acetyltransferase [Oceanirhabdus sp. W0125-5]WBW95572.1 GNAT family N-acetyltransferase [Oceanirhabdus sp. W0125-5]
MVMTEIKTLEKEDLDLLVPLAKEYREAHESLKFKNDYKEIFIKYFEGLLNDKEKVAIVAKVRGEIVGMIVGTIDDNSRLMLPEKIGYVPFLTVLKKARRNGIGKKLVEELNKWFKKRNINLIELYTSIDNSEAKEFWEKRGYNVYLERRFKEI